MRFFSSWSNLANVAITGLIAYATLVVLLRIFGKRTLAKLNAFDLVVTVALGSTLASIALPADKTLADGILVLLVLLTAQFGVSWLQVRSAWFRRVVKNEPALLYYRGQWLQSLLRRERVTQDEVLSAMRSGGVAQLSDVDAVVLETDGSLSIVRQGKDGERATTLGKLRETAG